MSALFPGSAVFLSGVVSAVRLQVAVGRAGATHQLRWVFAAVFVVYFALEPIQQLF